MMETNQKIYCTRCGQEHEIGDQYCGNCGYFLHDKDHLLREYLINHTKAKLQGSVEDKIFETIKNFLLSHLYGMVMTVTLAAALVTAVAAHPAPRAQKVDARPASVSGVLMAGEAPAATPVPTATPEPEPVDEGYYDYLRDTLLPQFGMATTEEVHIPYNGGAIWQTNGAQVSGVIGADVRDYDGDGVRDLLVLNLTVRPMGETALGRLMYEADGSVAYLDEGFSMLSTVSMAYVDEAIVYRAKDYTQLAEILERGEEAVKAERTPAPSPTPAPEHGDAEAETQAIADAVQSATGISLEKTRESMDETQYTVSYTAPDGSSVNMTYRLDTDKLRMVGVCAQGSTVTQEWITLKDAVLDLESLGFDADKTAKFHGDCGFRSASPEDVGGGAAVAVANAGTCVMLAQWAD